jgi:hypothetical protein
MSQQFEVFEIYSLTETPHVTKLFSSFLQYYVSTLGEEVERKGEPCFSPSRFT